ncbi:Uncharacterised protein [Yersinia frederiksenii]|uniref:Uncharacterized protein n=2 Tax=Yersinia frederiksenii TaxID=29484 RepID=A0A380PT57_YERFR|nr:hypothetical protein DJ58_3982 [Yersinia frederiksenii ATCC 33641]CNC62194.1 Uncharacterised protein [Yersinia frederiksenii]SUP76804.1 Uncharacterised protein [Yersinia frederiksenii]
MTLIQESKPRLLFSSLTGAAMAPAYTPHLSTARPFLSLPTLNRNCELLRNLFYICVAINKILRTFSKVGDE